MAASLLKLSVAAIWLSAILTAPAAEGLPRERLPIDLKTDSYEVDFRSGKTLMRNVVISQGDVSITAERAEATGLDFDDSRWVFSGDVHINAEQRGSMQSQRAEVEFRDNRIAKATVNGNPAQFEQKATDSSEMARGRAGKIEYEVGAGTVRLTGDAWLSNGDNQITGPLLVYDIRQQKVQGQRVRITIVPRERDDTKRTPALPSTPPQNGAGE